MKRHLPPIFDHAHRWWTISFFLGSVALLGFQVAHAQQREPSRTVPQEKPSPEKAKKLSELPAAVRDELDRLASDDAGKRATAIVSLGEMGQEAIPAIPMLIGALGDLREVIGMKGRFKVDELALQTLTNLGEPARKSLLDVLQEEDRDRDRDQVMWALGKMKETRAVEPLVRLLSNDKWREWAVPTLGNIGDPRAVEPLLKLLSLVKKDKYDFSNDYVAEALGKLKDSRAVEPLIAVLIVDSKADIYENEVMDALGHLKDPRAVEPLIAVLKKYEGYKNAKEALKKITGQDLKTSDDWARWWEQNKKTKQ